MAQSVWTGGSHHTGLAALPHENIQEYRQKFLSAWKIAEFTKDWTSIAFYKEREKKYLS